MPFDVDAARQAGYSDDEILSHLTASRKFDVDGAVKAGYSKPEIIQHLSSTPPAAADAPGAVSRFLHSAWDAINPIPAVQEYMNRPDDIGKATRGMSAAMRIRAGKEQPGDRQLLEEGMKANLNAPMPPVMPTGSEPALKAGAQAQQGDLAGAAGTLTGAYGVPAAAGAVIPKVAAPVRNASRRMYQSALKPQTVLKPAERAAVVETGIKEGIPVSEGGYEQAAARTDALNQEIASKIAQKSEQLGPVISPKSVAKRVDQGKPTFAQQVNPEADLNAMERSKQEFLRQHETEVPYTKVAPATDPELAGGAYTDQGPGTVKVEKPLTLAEAQAEKQGTYRQLRKKYGELGSAETEAQKALARGLKEEILAQYPELGALNAQDSAMIGLEQQLARFVNRHGNKDIMGIGTPIAAGAVGAVAGHTAPGIIAGIAKSALDNPAVKSQMAIALDRAAKFARPAGAAATAGGVLNASQNSQLPQYAKGGVIKRPTILVDAKSGKPSGIMAEKGAEAIVPLTGLKSPEKQVRHIVNSEKYKLQNELPKLSAPANVEDAATRIANAWGGRRRFAKK